MTVQEKQAMTIKGFAALEKGQELSSFDIKADPLGPWDVELAITHCGICHSDIHLIDNDWGNAVFPLVPGHEIIGTVTEKGELLNTLEIGQRVGIGWQRSSCMSCEWCLQGEENLCFKQEATCVGHPGGFAEKIRADGRFAFPIPDGLPSEEAAPLLCGGITVFSPFIEHRVSATSRVGVIGIGGLGHFALQFARAFGCEVTAFSHSKEKEAEAKALGAHHFIASDDEKSLEKAANSLDFIISTVSKPLNWDAYLNVLRPKGVLCFVGIQEKPVALAPFSVVVGRKTVCGSNIGSRPDIKTMLRFASQHQIKAQVEVFPMQDVNRAIERVRSGKVRYRAVLSRV